MRPRFEIRDAADGQVYVVLVAGNNFDLMTSELFPDVRTARKNIAAARRASLSPAVRVKGRRL